MIHVNFGWLNDYSGSKFAPFTLADKVLLNTENNTTESFYDFVKSQNLILSNDISTNKANIDSLENKIRGLTEPDDKVLEDNKIKREVSKQAMTLVTESGAYLNKGSNRNPVYFAEGIPQTCLTGDTVTEDIKEVGKGMYIEGWDDKGNSKFNEGTTFTKYNYSNDNYLNANISGKASYANSAEESKHSIIADIATQSQSAEMARTLSYNIVFGGPDNDTTNTDIEGIIYTQSRSQDTDQGTLYADNIHLKNILSKEISVGGMHSGSKIVVDIPVITVDTKGRITSATTTPYTPQLNIAGLINAATEGTVSRFPVLTAVGSNDGGWSFYTPGDNASSGVYLEYDSTNKYCILMGAAWNDYAEFRNQKETIEPGYCVASGDDGKVYKTSERFQACDGIVSDTYGFSIGKSETYQTPLAVSGRVLAYCAGNREDYHAGDTVCAGPEGKVCKMTRDEVKEYPDRIVGIVSEIPSYKEWNSKQINNRIWIKVK